MPVRAVPRTRSPAGVQNFDKVRSLRNPGYVDQVRSLNPELYWRMGVSSKSETMLNLGTANAPGTFNSPAANGAPTFGVTGPIVNDLDTAIGGDNNSRWVNATYTPFVIGSVKTFEAWASRKASPLSFAETGLFAPQGAWTAGFVLYLMKDPSLDFQMYVNGTLGATWASAWPGGTGFHHVALIVDMASATHTAELFIDGVSKGVKSSIGTYVASTGFSAGGETANGYQWNGNMDEFAIYPRALTAAEILSNHDKGLGIVPVTGDTTPPTPTITAGPTKSKISSIVGQDSLDFTWTSDEDFQHYQIRAVSSSSDTVAAGNLVEQDQNPVSGGTAGTPYTVTITAAELTAATAGDGTKLLKIFVQDSAGNWSL